MNIPNLFKNILNRQNNIGHPYQNTLNAPVDEEAILEAQRSLKFNLNQDLRELYFFANGNNIYHVPITEAFLIPIHYLIPLQFAAEKYLDTVRIEQYFEAMFQDAAANGELGKAFFPFMEDQGGSTYWVDLNEGTANYGKIYQTDKGEIVGYVFKSLRNMFEVILECYKEDIYYLDDRYLSVDWVGFGETCQKYNPDNKYWKTVTKNWRNHIPGR